MNELIADELSKLAQLKGQGILSQDEFDARKLLLLSRKPGSAAPTGLKAFFGCLGLIALIVLLPQIGAIFRGECIKQSTRSASDAAQDAETAANDAAKVAGKTADAAD